jgi:hypothetical protein
MTYSNTQAPLMLMPVDLVAFGPYGACDAACWAAPKRAPMKIIIPTDVPPPAFIRPPTTYADCSCYLESSGMFRFLNGAPGTQLHKM